MQTKRLSALVLFALTAAAAPVLADATIKGMVYDEKDRPVEDATVRLMHKDKGDKTYEEVSRTTTNEDGGFRLKKVDDGTYVLVVNKKQLRDRTTVVVKNDKDPAMLNFKIRDIPEADEDRSTARAKGDYVNFVGVVVDKNGRPVKGATVKLLTGDGDKKTDKMVTVDTTESEAKGRFEFYKVRFGHYIVEASDDGKSVHKEITLKDSDGTQSTELKLK